jgi:hypothetical protein
MTRCTFMGGGYSGTQTNNECVAVEGCKDVTFTDCIFYRGRNATFGCGASSGFGTGLTITGCTIDMNYDNGITQTGGEYHKENTLSGDDVTFTNNVIHNSVGGIMLDIDQLTNSVVTGNTFHDTRTTQPPWSLGYGSSSDSAITGNTFDTEYTSDLVLHDSGGNTNVTVTPNTFTHA